MEESQNNRTLEENANNRVVSTWLKSRHAGLLPHEEKGLRYRKYRAEHLNIGSHSPKRKRTTCGFSKKRCSVTKQKLEHLYLDS